MSSYRLMFWAIAAASALVAYNVGKIIGPGNWSGR